MKLHTIHDKEFALYGRVIDCDCSEIIDMAKKIELPKEGSTYLASVEDFENLEIKTQLEKEYFGEIQFRWVIVSVILQSLMVSNGTKVQK